MSGAWPQWETTEMMIVYCCTGHEYQNFSIYTVTSTVEENMHKGNDIGPEGGRVIGEALKDNFMFEEFDLSGKHY